MTATARNDEPARAKDGGLARALPPGKSVVILRHTLDMIERRVAQPKPDIKGSVLGWDAYLEMAYDWGLLDPRPKPSRFPEKRHG